MTLWKDWDGWKYEYFDLDEDVATFPGGEDFLNLWHKKRGDRKLPQWSDFQMEDFMPWIGNIVVSDILWDPFDYEYRLFGTLVAERFGSEVTGKKGSEIFDGNYVTGYDIEFYEMNAKNLYIGKSSGIVHCQGREDVKTTFLELPLSDNGERSTHAISLMI